MVRIWLLEIDSCAGAHLAIYICMHVPRNHLNTVYSVRVAARLRGGGVDKGEEVHISLLLLVYFNSALVVVVWTSGQKFRY